jgi:hypothetical protein
MAVHVAIATAPTWRGTIGDASAWSPATSTSTPTSSGVFTGSADKTFTLTVDDGGTVGAGLVTVDWDDGDGNSGRLAIGNGYSIGTALPLLDDVFVAFSSGTAVAGEEFSIAASAIRRLPQGAKYLSGRGEPCQIYVDRFERVDRDAYFPSEYADTVRVERERQINPTLSIDYMDSATHETALGLEALRHEICVGEDYDLSTILLWRHGTTPLIGPLATFTRTGALAGYYDSISGTVRQASANEMRYSSGPVGRAMVIDTDFGTTNLLPDFHGENDGTTEWFVNGSATIDWDDGAVPILDQRQGGWASEYLGGCERAYIPSGDYIHTVDYGCDASQWYSASLWLRGRGLVTIRIRSGNTTISGTVDEESITLTDTWTRYDIPGGQTGIGHDVADLQVVGNEDALVYVGPCQLEAGPSTGYGWPTDVSEGRGIESLAIPVSIPVDAGSLGFWFKLPDDTTGGQSLDLIDATGVTGNERFRITYVSNTAITVELTAAAGTDLFYVCGDLTDGAWHHLAVTWERGSAGKVEAILYLDGAAVATESDADWLGYFGSGILVGGTGCREVGFKELRIDGTAQAAAEILRWYERFTDDAWIALHRSCGGRKYMIPGGVVSTWRSPANPHHILQQMRPSQSGVFDDCLEISR